MRTLLLAALLGTASVPALAVGRLADVSITDRDTGQALTAHYYKGEYWVAGRPGAHYEIRINSRDGRRLLAVTSVDGVNILTGETAGVLQRGYVFQPWQGYSVAGWRKSDSEIAAFTFTSIPKSYASRTGRPQNVGVIGVALFPEKPRHYMPLPPPPAVKLELPAPISDEAELEEVPVTGARVQGGAADSSGSVAERRERAQALAPSLGTGHGRREHSVVVQVPFERESTTPAEVIRIRYDSHDNLVAMGVLPRTPPRPRPLDPFPDSRLGYVPDP